MVNTKTLSAQKKSVIDNAGEPHHCVIIPKRYFHSISFIAKWHKKEKEALQPMWKIIMVKHRGRNLFCWYIFFSFNFMNEYNMKLLFSPFYMERHSLYAQRGKMSVHGVKEIE